MYALWKPNSLDKSGPEQPERAVRSAGLPGNDAGRQADDGLSTALGKLHAHPQHAKIEMEKPANTIISMPLIYWELHLGYWKLTPQDLKDAMKRPDKIIGRIKDGTYLVIGNESNRR